MANWNYRFTNFEKSFKVLTEDIDKYKSNQSNQELHDLLRAGLIHVYEHTLELAWKLLKDYLEDQGFTEINSPKKAVRTAFAHGHIRDGELWLVAIDDRNLVTHDYDENLAQDIAKNIIDKYYFLLSDLYEQFMHKNG